MRGRGDRGGFLGENRALLAISLGTGMSMAGLGMVVPVRVLYAQSHGASLAIIGAMASAFLLSNFLSQYPIGWVADAWGKRRVMVLGLVGQAIITLIYLVVPDPLVFVGLRLVEGVFSAAVNSPARAILADVTPEQGRGQAYGIFNSFSNGGFLLGPALGGVLAATGYSSAFIASTAFRIFAVVLVVLFVREGRRAHHEEREAARLVPMSALWTAPLLGAYILFFGDSLFLGFDLTLMPLWMKHHLGATVTTIGLGYAFWAFPNMLLSPFGGRTADRVRRSLLIVVFGLLQVPFYITYGLLTSVVAVMILFSFHGIVYAMMQPAIDAHLAAFSPVAARARVQGLYSAVGTASAFLAANTLPFLYGVNYRLPLFAMAGGFLLCVLVGASLVRRAERQVVVESMSIGSRAAE